MSTKSKLAPSKAVLSTLSLLVGASAQAGHYPAGNDPAGNGTVPGFTGQYILTIADGCFSSPGFHSVVPNTSCGFASVFSGTVDLYALTGPPTPPVLDSFSLVNLSFPPDNWLISEVFINNDLTLGGVDTGLMGPYQTTGPYSVDFFSLQFLIEGDPTADAFLTAVTDNTTSTSPPGMMVFGSACTDSEVANGTCRVSIPEPGSLSLLFAALAALGGGWLTKRRARKT